MKGIVLLVCVALLLVMPPMLPPRIGQIDFPAYWSASYLLARGENFGDPARLLQIEQTLTTWPETYPMLTWNPPWLLVILLPYTLVPFERAAWWWMLTNITLVSLSALALWRMKAATTRMREWLRWAPVFAFAFAPTLVALIAGQVNLLVLIGITGYLFFRQREQYGWAGIALALTMVKPHLVYLTVPLVLYVEWRQRRWRVLGGFFGTLSALTLLVFLRRPTFLLDYATAVEGGRLFEYVTPTVGGILAWLLGWDGWKWIGVVVLPLALWYVHRLNNVAIPKLVDVTLLVSIVTAPFGWSYDFVILLVPLFTMLVWLGDGTLARNQLVVIVGLMILADALIFYQRVVSPAEFYFFWIPLAIAAFYAWILMQRQVYA